MSLEERGKVEQPAFRFFKMGEPFCRGQKRATGHQLAQSFPMFFKITVNRRIGPLQAVFSLVQVSHVVRHELPLVRFTGGSKRLPSGGRTFGLQ